MGSEAVVNEWADAVHVVMVPYTTSGHTIPFLKFAKRLACEGVVTTIFTSDKHLQELEKTLGTTDFTSEGYPLRVLGLRDKTSLDLSHLDWKERMREVPSEEHRVVGLLESGIKDLSSPAAFALRGVHPATPPVCILHDMFECWAQEVADRLHIAKHLLYASPATALSCALHSQRLYQKGLVPVTCDKREVVIEDIPGLLPTLALDLPTHFLDAAMYGWMRHHHNRFRETDVILLNTFYDLENSVLDALRNDVIGSPGMQAKTILDIGPLLPDSPDACHSQSAEEIDPDPCISWLDTRAPSSVLFVSFGSNATHSAVQLQELALGLEASGVSFLWIVRPPDAPGFSAATETEPATEYLPGGFEERVKDRGLCYSQWAPQTEILKHPAVGGFLSHCGWNSTIETVCDGVPVLAWPIFSEQHLNRRFLVDTVRVAIELKGREYTKEELESDEVMPVRFVSKEEIAEKARSLMLEKDGEIVRQNVQKMRAKAQAVTAPGGSSQRNFEAYLRLLQDIRNSRATSQPCP